ncbi:MAG TPA: hypothetical protein VK191_03690 [Symbiobacteriaceae bacterium]|nr:hypothetical protein [Symbiobacteriaceae bacterium]
MVNERAERVISLLHSEVIRAVQEALAQQLKQDGKAAPGQELGLTFYASTADQMTVVCEVREGGRPLFQMQGGPAQLAAVAAGVALRRLSPAERRRVAGDAAVRWRSVRLDSGGGEALDRFFVDVTFPLRSDFES